MASTRLTRGGARVAAVLDQALEGRDVPSLDDRLTSLRALRKERRKSGPRRVQVAMLAAAVVCGGVFGIYDMSRPLDITFSVEGAPGEVGAWVAATSEPIPLRFSDGSRFDLRPSGRARVVGVNERGAQLLLERGAVGADVVHREKSAWTVAAGPFEVHVIGTRFEAAWDPATEVLTVALDEGRVEVTGPCLREARPVVEGESVRVSCRDVIAKASASPMVDGPLPEPTPTPNVASSASATPAPEASASAVTTPPAWRDLSRRGDYAAAFDAASEQGIESIASRASAPELLELADVARLAKHPDVARRVYVTLRDRFAGTDGAAGAAFHLGRMSFGANASEAERWFSTYLTERPGGPFAAEALGRVMEIQHRAGQTDAARATAARYLAAYPTGAHAALAQSLIAP
jgi:hypothetical protein